MWSITSSITESLCRTRKGVYRLTPTSPFRRAISANCRSVRLRGWRHSARESLCVATNGPSIVSHTSQNPRSDRWDTSTMIPFAAQSRTSCFPSAVNPSS